MKYAEPEVADKHRNRFKLDPAVILPQVRLYRPEIFHAHTDYFCLSCWVNHSVPVAALSRQRLKPRL